MHPGIIDHINTLNNGEGWDEKYEEGFLALPNLEIVEIVMESGSSGKYS